MTENEFILADRLQKIQSTIEKYGEDNFYLSFSGGKDSCVLSTLLDMALPGNKIPRVYADTGIEYKMIRDFVYNIKKSDDRVVIIKPFKNIKETLDIYGYPFKSKKHSLIVNMLERMTIEESETIKNYLGLQNPKSGIILFSENKCPKILRYQFYEKLPFKISSLCCDKLKKEPLKRYQEENEKKYCITGIMASEGGQRKSAKCLAFSGDKLLRFNPLAPISKEWETWFISEYNISICDIYKPPYNFKRTGCKGCPFAIELQKELDTLEKYFPQEKAQCEIIWRPVYAEYRRIGYRLRKEGD